MKTYNPVGIISITAAASIVKNRFIGFNGNLCAANAKAIGVSDANTGTDEQLPVVIGGIALIASGAAVSQGNALVSNASGKAIPATAFSVTVPSGATQVTSSGAQPDLVESGSVLPQSINGYALDTATGADELIRILIV